MLEYENAEVMVSGECMVASDVMSSCLFCIYVDGVVREVNAKIWVDYV